MPDLWFDKNGQPVDMIIYSALRADPSYFRVEESIVGHYDVSTVWLGLDHSLGEWRHPSAKGIRRPVIFETLVFGTDPRIPWWADHCTRYCTEEGARKGHVEIVNEMLAELAIAIDMNG